MATSDDAVTRGRVEVLGVAQVTVGDRTVSLGSPRQRALLAMVALHAPLVVTADRLVRVLWRDEPPASASHALRVHASELRKRWRTVGEGDLIRTDGDGYALADGIDVDAVLVAATLGDIRAAIVAGRADVALVGCDGALSWWRGTPFADLDDDPDAVAERSRLDEVHAQVLDERAEAMLELGRHLELLPDLEQRVRAEPLRERPYRQLMVALYRAGRQGDALEVYQRARTALLEQLGVTPGPMLRETEAAVLQQDPALLAAPRHDTTGPVSTAGFVGRDGDVAELLGPLRGDAGGGRMVLLSGAPGVGKTRLAAELAAATGRRVLSGACPEGGGAPPWWPLAEALRPIGSLAIELLADRIDPVALAPLVAAVGDRPPVEVEQADVDAFRSGAAGAALVVAVAAREPTVLVLDDLQWADAATLGVVRHLARLVGRHPVSVVATHRSADDDLAGRLGEVLGWMSRQDAVISHTVAPLDDRSADSYVRGAGLDADDDVIETVVRRSEGNALALTELVALLRRQGPTSLDRLPVGLAQVLDHRLASVGDASDVLARAAILGRVFPIDVLARIVDAGADRVTRALALGRRAGLLDVTGHDGSFTHLLLAERAAAGLDDDERRRVHLLAADAWSRRTDLPSLRYTTEIARHRTNALPLGDAVEAAVACLRAGDDAMAANAYDDALEMYESARQACTYADRDESSDRALIDALVGVGECRMLLGDTAEARPALLDAIELSRQVDDDDRFALAVRVLATARATSAGVDETVGALLDEAAERLADRDSWLRVQLLCDRALVRYHTVGREEGVSIAEEALATARRLDDPKAVSFALTGLHGTVLTPDTVDRRWTLADEAARTAEAAGVEWQQSMALTFRAMASWELGHLDRVTSDLTAASILAERSGRTRFRWMVRCWTSLLALFRGDLDTAEAGFADALALWGRSGNPDAFMASASHQLTVQLVRGEAGAMVDLLQAVAANDPNPLPWIGWSTLPLVQAGCDDDATAALDHVLAAGLDAIPRDVTWTAVMALMAETAAAVGHVAMGRALLPALEPFRGRQTVVNVYGGGGFCWGSLTHQIGLLEVLCGDAAAGQASLEDALAEHERLGAEPFAARTRAALEALTQPRS